MKRVHVSEATGVPSDDYVAWVGWIYHAEFTVSLKRWGIGAFTNFRYASHHTLLSVVAGPFAFRWIRWKMYA